VTLFIFIHEEKLPLHATQRSAKPLPNPDSAPISFQLKNRFGRKKIGFRRSAPANSAFAGTDFTSLHLSPVPRFPLLLFLNFYFRFWHQN